MTQENEWNKLKTTLEPWVVAFIITFGLCSTFVFFKKKWNKQTTDKKIAIKKRITKDLILTIILTVIVFCILFFTHNLSNFFELLNDLK